MKKKQLPHTCSRKGYARLAEEMVKFVTILQFCIRIVYVVSLYKSHFVEKGSLDPTSITKVALWTKAHRKKDGTPVNSEVAEILVKLQILFYSINLEYAPFSSLL